MLDWYSYLTEEFKLAREIYRVNDRYPFSCSKCGESKIERLNHVKSKIKKLGYYECGGCRKRASIKRARAAFKDKHGDVNPYQLESTKEKIKQTTMERYGVDCVLRKKEVHSKGIIAAAIVNKNKPRKIKIDTPEDKIRRAVYRALNRMLKGKEMSKTSVLKNIGYTMEELRSHIENQFQPGMTWNNHGKWHLDHIKPLSLFDCNNLEEIKKANALNNLQPLWAFDNRSKSNSY